MTTRLVQLTDLHLFRDPGGLLAGVPTWASFRAILDQVRRGQGNLDYLILTGDLAQDEALETYLMLREELGEWLARLRIIPGNHDDRDNLRTAFPELFPSNEGTLGFDLSVGGWRIIGLDSQVPGEVYGRVDGPQLAWLKTELASSPGTPTVLFVHHPPVPIDVAWLDEIGLNEATDLLRLIETSAAVKIVCAGHVHQEFSGRIGAAEMYTTPSTCVQFGARADDKFDTAMTGYRTFTLDADRHHTEVHLLTQSPLVV